MLKKIGYLVVGLLLLAGAAGIFYFKTGAAARAATANTPYQTAATQNNATPGVTPQQWQQCQARMGVKSIQQMAKSCPYLKGKNPNQVLQGMGSMMQSPSMQNMMQQMMGPGYGSQGGPTSIQYR